MIVCVCHGVPTTYDGRCRVDKRARDNANLLTEKGRARKRRFRTQEYLTRLKELTKPSPST